MKMLNTPNISVIISTYNSEEWLEKVLWSYSVQSFKNFEIVIADDGSRDKTRLLIDDFRSKLSVPVIHVWQEDNGFQKTKILNKAILKCNSEYIIMTDGDCIARRDFVEQHNKLKRKGCFLSGGYFKLDLPLSNKIRHKDIVNNLCFNLTWLKSNGLKKNFRNIKLYNNNFLSNLFNLITPTKPTWNGHNSSGWKKDMILINGFDERMAYGGEDREFGDRLLNIGVKPIQIRYSAICLHLDHPRGYVSRKVMDYNMSLRKKTKSDKINKTSYGIIK